MKNILLCLIILGPNFTLACQSADPNNVVLFLNINRQSKEKEMLYHTACANGQTLIEWPISYHHQVSEKSLKDFTTSLTRQGRTIRSLTISGHNGGSRIYSKYSTQYPDRAIMVKDIADALGRSVRADINSVYLMGCFTGAHGDFAAIKDKFKNATIIAGYDSMGPLGSNPLSSQNISNLMNSERRINTESNVHALKSLLDSATVDHHKYTCSAFVRDGQNREWFFKDTKNPLFTPFSGNICDQFTPQLVEGLKRTFFAYYNGTIDVTNSYNTSSGAIRGVYSQMRSFNSCIKRSHRLPHIHTVFMLNFFNNVKMNFAHNFAPLVNHAAVILNNMGHRELSGFFKPQNLARSSRTQILNAISNLGAVIKGTKWKWSDPNKKVLKSLYENANDHLKLLEDTPEEWHSPNTFAQYRVPY